MPSDREIHKFDEMTEPELAKYMTGLAGVVGSCLPDKTAFIVLLAPMGGNSCAQYIGNVKREDAIRWMEETIARFRAGDTIDRGAGG